MTKKNQTFSFKKIKHVLPYVAAALLTLALVFVGSLDKQNSNMNLSLSAFAVFGSWCDYSDFGDYWLAR